MRIRSIRLENYKRFTDLRITDIPDSARLVVMLGPNGTGKSSVFDAFLLKSNAAKTNMSVRGGVYDGYFIKYQSNDNTPNTTHEVARKVTIDLDVDVLDWSTLFCIRSPYRHEADFTNANFGPVKSAHESVRFQRIIDQDRAVSENFSKLGRTALYDALKGAPSIQSMQQFREETIGELKVAIERLFGDPLLSLQDLGTSLDSGAFRFKKGSTDDFDYKNLSGGEKAAFDLLLDVFVKRSEYLNAIYCIDEPESHVASAVHGRLLEAILDLIPVESQLWIATHSIGFVRKSLELYRRNGNVAFLDFSEHDFDREVHLYPATPNKHFFRRMYNILEDDLAGLVAPSRIVLCEGRTSGQGTDAKIYNTIFEESHPDTLFISRGGSNDVENSDLIAVLGSVVPNVRTWRLIDRDDMTESTRIEKVNSGVRVLRRREIENYLWDKAVIEHALQNMGIESEAMEHVLNSYPFTDPSQEDMKADYLQQQFFEIIKGERNIALPGRNRREFAEGHLAPALREVEGVYRELLEDVFPPDLQ